MKDVLRKNRYIETAQFNKSAWCSHLCYVRAVCSCWVWRKVRWCLRMRNPDGDGDTNVSNMLMLTDDGQAIETLGNHETHTTSACTAKTKTSNTSTDFPSTETHRSRTACLWKMIIVSLKINNDTLSNASSNKNMADLNAASKKMDSLPISGKRYRGESGREYSLITLPSKKSAQPTEEPPVIWSCTRNCFIILHLVE